MHYQDIYDKHLEDVLRREKEIKELRKKLLESLSAEDKISIMFESFLLNQSDANIKYYANKHLCKQEEDKSDPNACQ